MSPDDSVFVRDFFRALVDRPLEPDDPQYVGLYENRELADVDPVEQMARGVEWTTGNQSVQLLSGFRGTGKSTELRRLRKRLRDAGYIVLLFDIEDYLNTSERVHVSDFLITLAGAVGDIVVGEKLLPDAGKQSYWDRVRNFLAGTRVDVSEVTVKLGVPVASVDFKANIKSDPSFTTRLRDVMAGLLGQLVEDVNRFLAEIAESLTAAHPGTAGVVLVVDSVEHIRGTSSNVEDVQASIEELFAGHADDLRLRSLHVVYTVPPWLKVRYQNLGPLYSPGGVQVLPALKVRTESDGTPFPPGLDAIEAVVGARAGLAGGTWERLLGDRAALDRLSLASAGHLRDMLYMLQLVSRRAEELPVGGAVLDRVIAKVTEEFLPIPDADAVWLWKVAQTHRAALADIDKLPTLARFLDTHLVLCYWNGHEWYDLHPLVHDEVERQVDGPA